jgi:hypothetical protein
MKLISFRVTVAADSDALVGEVQTRLRALVEAAGIEPMGPHPDETSPRVFWPTVEVVQGPDRPPWGSRSRKRARADISPSDKSLQNRHA